MQPISNRQEPMTKSIAKTNRVDWLDTSRGIAFIMVIFDHMDLANTTGINFVTPVFLTTFFLVSGYLFKEEVTFLKMLEQRTRTLIIPFLILGSFLILTSSIVSLNEKQIGIRESFIELLTQYGYAHINTMWFIPSLYFYSIVFYLLMSVKSGWKGMAAMAFTTFLINWIYMYLLKGPQLPWHIEVTGFACCYMFIGKIYKCFEEKIDNRITTPICIISAAIYLSYIISTNQSCNFYGSPLAIDSLLLTLFGMIVMIKVSKNLNSQFIKFVGANSLLYFAFHGKAMSFVNVVFTKFGFVISEPVLPYNAFLIVKALIVAVLLIPVCLLVNRYIPQILGRNYKLW